MTALSRILVLGGTSELALAILAALDAPAGTEVIEFSPTEALNATMTVVGANLAAAAGTPS